MKSHRTRAVRNQLPTLLVGGICVAMWFCAASCQAWWCECCGCYWGPPGISALDTPLRPYYIPRCPAWGEHCYKYRVAGPCHGGPVGGPCGGSMNGGFAAPLSPELAETFAPYGFERMGQIPNDGVFTGSAPPTR